MNGYKVLMDERTLDKVREYKQALISGEQNPGKNLEQALQDKKLKNMSDSEFIEAILNTKQYYILAEQSLNNVGEGKGWNNTEFDILGNISIAAEVEAYDKGQWNMNRSVDGVTEHDTPQKMLLIFTPGLLLVGGSPDRANVVDEENMKIKEKEFDEAYSNKLRPTFLYSNEYAEKTDQAAVVNTPGMGAGFFGGEFASKVPENLDRAVQGIIAADAQNMPNVAHVQLDPFFGKAAAPTKPGNGTVNYQYKPATDGAAPQLATPKEHGYDSSKHNNKPGVLVKIVAWDHLSYPMNDFFYGNTRLSDDGMVGAATNIASVMNPKVQGEYDKEKKKFLAPKPYKDWLEAEKNTGLKLEANSANIVIACGDGKCKGIDEVAAQVAPKSKLNIKNIFGLKRKSAERPKPRSEKSSRSSGDDIQIQQSSSSTPSTSSISSAQASNISINQDIKNTLLDAMGVNTKSRSNQSSSSNVMLNTILQKLQEIDPNMDAKSKSIVALFITEQFSKKHLLTGEYDLTSGFNTFIKQCENYDPKDLSMMIKECRTNKLSPQTICNILDGIDETFKDKLQKQAAITFITANIAEIAAHCPKPEKMKDAAIDAGAAHVISGMIQDGRDQACIRLLSSGTHKFSSDVSKYMTDPQKQAFDGFVTKCRASHSIKDVASRVKFEEQVKHINGPSKGKDGGMRM